MPLMKETLSWITDARYSIATQSNGNGAPTVAPLVNTKDDGVAWAPKYEWPATNPICVGVMSVRVPPMAMAPPNWLLATSASSLTIRL